MLVDFRTIADGATLDCDLCVVGAGAAGIALARELVGSSLRVCLLESGGTEPDDATRDLNRGEIAGDPYQPLETTRARFFGGTTNTWVGACVPMSAPDFRERPWVPYSGWPITRAVLDPYYPRASALCGVRPGRWDAAAWRALGLPDGDFDPAAVDVRFWQYSAPLRFGEAYRGELEAAENVQVWLHANAVALRADASAARLDHVEVRSLVGNGARVRARATVLATGGLENARLLLASNDVEPAGLGNRHDTVGRYFMEHAYYQAGFVAHEDGGDLARWFGHTDVDEQHVLAGLHLSEAVQREESVLNACAVLDAYAAPDSAGLLAARRLAGSLRRGERPAELGEKILDVLRDLDDVLAAGAGRWLHGDARHYEEEGLALFVQSEQAPNPESRVRLTRERDALGVPRLALEWRLTELDRRTVEVAARRVSAELARLRLGRARLSDWVGMTDERWRDGLAWGHHHMGTTRMAHDPRVSVVDADCRVHSVEDLYVAGCSVFPTGGYANPTLTLVALALRLADHLRERLAPAGA